ncbi:MAG: Fpg/Nei family DNA glycosylase [Archangiaceae bacterium]|nr:Fpg/Nei family DNA glycosylase [Archangiaceae bacterium]
MPEGDTLLRAAKTLQLALSGKRVVGFESRYANVAVAAENHPLVGETVEKVESVGKHLLIRFSNGYTLRTHMRMNGSWHVYRRSERWKRPNSAMRLLLRTDDFEAVAFDVPVAELVDDKQLQRGEVGKLGPDLLGDGPLDVDEVIARLRRSGPQPIGELLLDQRVAAGIGNVYKSEVLFLCGVRPDRRGPEVPDEKLRELYATAEKLMRLNVAVGSDDGIQTYLGLRRTTRSSDPSQRLWVYGRQGEPCRKCRTPIAFFKQGLGARSTYFCPTCQR